uniref:Uncharacterized protein n=1 Tax=Toxoplasma gondii COUG TaxID=1074873 RepID=A0A2G8Y0A8_TOXGO|nr:hypothetical protein TGCOUG_314540 [Toxoplasma gondii COUG]
MSSIRERQAEQTSLLGRSRAERLLDGIYQRQKKYLLQQRRRAAAEAASRIVLPEEKRRRLILPETSSPSADASAGQKAKDKAARTCSAPHAASASPTSGPKSVEDAVATLQRHMWRRAKFPKAVKLFQQLWKSHFSPSTKRCLLAGFLTAASTDTCVNAPEGRTEVQTFFRETVEPLLENERRKRQDVALCLERARAARAKAREAVLQAQLESVVRPRDSSGGKRRHDGSKEVSSSGRQATVAAVAQAAAALVADLEDAELRRGEGQQARGLGGDPRDGVGSRGTELGNVTKAEAADDEVTLLDEEKELLEILQLRCKTHLLLFTDDPFQFNQQVTELRRTLDSIAASVQAVAEEVEEEPEEVEAEGQNATQGADSGNLPRDRDPSPLPDSQDREAAAERHSIQDDSHVCSSPTSVLKAPEDSQFDLRAGEGERGSDEECEATASALTGSEKEDSASINSAVPTAAPLESPGDGADPGGEDIDEDVFEDSPEVKWPLPLKKFELLNLMRCFFIDCLATVFTYRSFSWARASIEQLFQHVYLHRSIFSESDQGQISLWQAQLKVAHKSAMNITALGIGEAAHPVQDGRDERISTVHGSIVWSAKQMGC